MLILKGIDVSTIVYELLRNNEFIEEQGRIYNIIINGLVGHDHVSKEFDHFLFYQAWYYAKAWGSRKYE